MQILFFGFRKGDVSLADEIAHCEYSFQISDDIKRMGMVDYIFNVVVPSLTNNLLDRMGKLPYDYYSYPWEAEANQLVGVSISQNKPPLPPGGYSSYWDLLKLFFGG